jgi:hypothetical protein
MFIEAINVSRLGADQPRGGYPVPPSFWLMWSSVRSVMFIDHCRSNPKLHRSDMFNLLSL